MKIFALACLCAVASAGYTWDSCGVKYDRLATKTVDVAGSLTAGSKVSVTASGDTNLHVPLESGAWQVRVYEGGVAKETHTEFGDLMDALKFDDTKNTTFTMKVSFTLPKKEATGEFLANLVALDQAKADYLCLEIKYNYSEVEAIEAQDDAATCLHHVDLEDHKCLEACAAQTGFAVKGVSDAGSCPSNYNTVDKTQTVTQCPDGVTNPRYCTAINVTMTTKGEAMALFAQADTCLHHVDLEDHKCLEACAAQTGFAVKGVSDAGSCPSNYNTVDKTQTVTQCPDGVTNPRYCTAINVTMTTKGEAFSVPMQYFIGSNAECSQDADCPSSYCQNGFCHGCFDKCCETTSDCTKKGLGYCQNDSTKMPPYFCHA
jgi:hypothetical protein